MARRNLVNLEAVSKAFGDRALLAGVSMGIGAGQRIGVVGRNGAGKSTLLQVIEGDEPVDSGRVSCASDVAIGYLRQNPPFDPDATISQAVTGGIATHEWAGDARAREILTALIGGFDDEANVRKAIKYVVERLSKPCVDCDRGHIRKGENIDEFIVSESVVDIDWNDSSGESTCHEFKAGRCVWRKNCEMVLPRSALGEIASFGCAAETVVLKEMRDALDAIDK